MRLVDERRHADPLSALTAHLRRPDHLALAGGAEDDHRVTADPGAHERAVGGRGGGVVRAPRAEEGRAPGVIGRTERRERLDLRPRRARHEALTQVLDVDPPLEPVEQHGSDQVRAHGAGRGQQRQAELVAFADHPRGTRPVEDLLGLGLEERPLVLDHQQLVDAERRGLDGMGVERPDHPHLEHAHADPLEVAGVEAEDLEGLVELGVGLAGGHDAQPRVRGAHREAVEVVGAGVLRCAQEAFLDERTLQVQARGRQQPGVGNVRGLVPGGHDRPHPLGADEGGRGAVGHVGDDLQRRPETGCPRAGDPVQAEVDDVLHRGGVEGRDGEVGQCRLRRARQGGGLAHRGRRRRGPAHHPSARSPTALPWRNASAARSRPGALPYQ